MKWDQSYRCWINSPSNDTKFRYIDIAINDPSSIKQGLYADCSAVSQNECQLCAGMCAYYACSWVIIGMMMKVLVTLCWLISLSIIMYCLYIIAITHRTASVFTDNRQLSSIKRVSTVCKYSIFEQWSIWLKWQYFIYSNN